MSHVTRRLRGALVMGVIWAVAWAVGGLLIGVASLLLPFLPWDAFFNVFDAPLPALAIPGFIGGVLFSVVLGIAGRNRRFSDLSLPGFAAWGAIGGLLVGVFPALATMGEGATFSAMQLLVVIAAPMMLFGAVSAASSLALARKGEAPELEAGPDAASRAIGSGE